MGSVKSTFRKLSLRAFIFLVYLFIGAAIFLKIERNNSALFIKARWWENYTRNFRLKWDIDKEEFDIFQRDITDFINSGDMDKALKAKTTWSYVNAFFFCGNVITTIGYGHITPKTTFGRIIMILYALFGIPLTGIFLRTVGNEMTTFFAYLVKYLERRVYNREAEKLEMKCVYIASFLAAIMILGGGIIFGYTEEEWNFIDGIYFSFVTLTTIGFGDFVPKLTSSDNFTTVTKMCVEIVFLFYYVIGLSTMSCVIVSISAAIEEKTKKLEDPMEAIRNLRIENLNSKALKKLGYKVDQGFQFPATSKNNHLNDRRGTIVPADEPLRRRISKLGTGVRNLVNIDETQNGDNNNNSNSKKKSFNLKKSFNKFWRSPVVKATNDDRGMHSTNCKDAESGIDNPIFEEASHFHSPNLDKASDDEDALSKEVNNIRSISVASPFTNDSEGSLKTATTSVSSEFSNEENVKNPRTPSIQVDLEMSSMSEANLSRRKRSCDFRRNSREMRSNNNHFLNVSKNEKFHAKSIDAKNLNCLQDERGPVSNPERIFVTNGRISPNQEMRPNRLKNNWNEVLVTCGGNDNSENTMGRFNKESNHSIESVCSRISTTALGCYEETDKLHGSNKILLKSHSAPGARSLPPGIT